MLFRSSSFGGLVGREKDQNLYGLNLQKTQRELASTNLGRELRNLRLSLNKRD